MPRTLREFIEDCEAPVEKVPPNTLRGLHRYVEHKQRPGGFLSAVLSNDLCETIIRADDANCAALHDIVGFLWWNVRGDCWGSPEKVEAWLKTTTPPPKPERSEEDEDE